MTDYAKGGYFESGLVPVFMDDDCVVRAGGCIRPDHDHRTRWARALDRLRGRR